MQETKKDSDLEPLTNSGYNVNNTKGQNTTELDNEIQARKKKKIKYGLIGGVALIALVLIIVLPIVLVKKKDDHHDDDHHDDHPPLETNPYSVDKSSIVDNESSLTGILYLNTQTLQTIEKQTYQSLNEKKVLGDDGKLGLDWRKLPVGGNNPLISKLRFNIDMLDYKIARYTLTDGSTDENTRFSIPDDIINKPKTVSQMRLEMLGFEAAYDPTFYFSFSDVTDRSNVFITTKNQTLIMMDKYIQMDMLLPSQKIYGFGERVHEFGLGEGTWTMWASGQDSPYDDGRGRKGTYGVHPFALVQSGKSKDDYFGIFFRNSNAQSPFITYRDDGKAVLSYITIGGQIEAYFFLHGTAKDVIQQYQAMFGKPQLPPFWALGWQQASWKYVNQQLVEEVVTAYSDNNMPLETVYFDIPYMNKYSDFSVDTEAFKNITGFVETLHNNGQKLVVIIDAAISADDTDNKYYKLGNEKNIFIQSAMNTEGGHSNNLVNQVWPNRAVFVDWSASDTTEFLRVGLDDLTKICPFDGLWLDMNEPTTFQNGEIIDKKSNVKESQKRILADSSNNDWFLSLHSDDINDYYNLPFIVIGSDSNSGNYDNMTISLNATHPGANNGKEYNLHSLNGHLMAQRTNFYLTNRSDDRPFILSRSTFATSGKYTSHWLGDNWRDWKYMKYSIAGIMNMNMFGIPHVGADVCGFFGEKKDNEMCLRWIQLSTFYPLARAHQNLTYKNGESERTEPYYLDEPYKTQARESLYDRYSYLRLMYTCLFEASQNGGSCVDPLFFHYPNDENLYSDYESTFMVAGAVKVSPILESLEGNNFTSYFPQGRWASLVDNKEVIDASNGGMTADLLARPKINAHLRPGSLIPHQNNDMHRVKTTTDLLKEPISIVANRDSYGSAKGTLFLDQGISRAELSNRQYEYYQISLQANTLQFRLTDGHLYSQSHTFGKLMILDASNLVNTSFACYFDHKNELHNSNEFLINYHADSASLEITPNNEIKFNQIKSIHFGQQGELNMCDSTSYQYRVVKGQQTDLKSQTAKIELEHIAGTLPNIVTTMRYLDQGIVNVKWTWTDLVDGKKKAVEVPQELINTTTRSTSPPMNLSSFVTIQENPFQIHIKSRNIMETEPMFKITGMIYDQYLNWIQVQLKTQKDQNFTGIMGLGERANTNMFYEDGVYTMWAQDHGTPDEDGMSPTKGMYGTHPFYMYKHNVSSWVGVYTNLAHAQDWWVKNNKKDGLISLSTIATGGVADLYIMLDQQTPEKIIERYYSIIGKPVLIPQWALGWNQCKWGYNSAQDILDAADGYTQNNIPLDVQWSDIDYMNSYRDFTYDPKNFAKLPEAIKQLHDKNVRFVPIVDAGIAYRPNQGYSAYDEGAAKDVFLKINENDEFIGKVWPNEAVFPDFFNNETTPWWQKQLDSMYSEVQFDGLWLDMNEIANFCDGVCQEKQRPQNPLQNQLPYTPGGINLETHGVPLDVTHSNGYTQLDSHSYWGTQEVKATHEWFAKNDMRTFIIERSSFAGMGKFGSRWLGDNNSDEKQMGYSVSGIMLMNMFGIPLAGADICGFGGNTNADLCARWHTVGSFYPFSRNHNAIGSDPQEPWQFKGMYDETRTYEDVMREAIIRKYKLVRYYYTSLVMMSTEGQKPFFKPLFFAFPEDVNAYKDIIYNVMLGDSLKLSFNSDTVDSKTTSFYMPAGTWCDVFRTFEKCIVSKGEFMEMNSRADDAHVHLRQGQIVPLQSMDYDTPVMNTVDLNQQPVDFHVLGEVTNPDTLTWSASGIYYNDDGVSLNNQNKNNSYSISVARRLTGTPAVEKIQMKIYTINRATDKQSKEDANCYAVNQNDFLGKVYFYNAAEWKTTDSFVATATGVDGKAKGQVGTAIYDSATQRIVFTPSVPICLTSYLSIDLIPQ